MLRFLTAGESHGPALVVIVEGLPAGLPVPIEDIAAELARRRLGFGRGPRMRFEHDEVEFLGGVRHGRTLGSPVAIVIRNTEWPKWQDEMSPAPGRTERPLHQPRPGPRRPRRHAEVRVRRRPRRPRTGQRPRDRRPRRGGRARQGAARPPRHLGPQPRRRARLGARRPERRPTPADLETVDAPRCVASTPTPRRHDPRDRGRREGRRLARRGRRGPRLRRPPGLGSPRALGSPHRRSPRAGAHEHPGDEGRRDRRRVRTAGGGAARRTTRSSGTTTPANTGGARPVPAASRAA